MAERLGKSVDLVVVGAGAVGVSTAYHAAKRGLEVAVIEKEAGPAEHQSGRNSGVIHSGYNLSPGSLKARYCIEGNRRLYNYCAENGIKTTMDGILVVAAREDEVPTLETLHQRGMDNGVEVSIKIGQDEIADIEPNAVGLAALHAPTAGSIDSKAYVSKLAEDAQQAGVKFYYGARVKEIVEPQDSWVYIPTEDGRYISASAAVNASGLWADKLSGHIAEQEGLRVVPFRGYYAELKPGRTGLVKSHIYGTPDLSFPFLGVHLSKRTDGRVIAGPGAMMALGREAYDGPLDFSGGGLRELYWEGTKNLLQRKDIQHLIGSEVLKSLCLQAIVFEAKQLVPKLGWFDLRRSFAGNRAQVIDRQGKLVDDMKVVHSARTLHVLNAVSPGLTASLPFGEDLADSIAAKLRAA